LNLLERQKAALANWDDSTMGAWPARSKGQLQIFQRGQLPVPFVADLGSMRQRELNIFFDPAVKGPLYFQVAEAIQQAIRAGRIQAGDSLPGTRDLAERLGVTRNTVAAALRELEAQGWVQVRPQSGFFVSESLPESPITTSFPGAGRPVQTGFDMPSRLAPVTDLGHIHMDLTDGVADARLAPTEALSRAYQRGLKLKGTELLGSSDFKGLMRLRKALAEHLSIQRACRFEADQLLLIRSTSMAVSLVAQALVGSEGGAVVLEDPGHPQVRETLGQACAGTLCGIPVDGEGLLPESLRALLAQTRIALLVLTPQCHYPTGAVMSPKRRAQILELAREHRFPILELDTEYDYLSGPPRPLAAEDDTGQVIYVGSLSRVYAPGIRLGFMAPPQSLADRLAKARQRVDWQGDPLLEWAISELLLEGEHHRQLRRIRKASLERRGALVDSLLHSLADRLDFDGKAGGMGLWLRGKGPLEDPERFELWIKACALKGLKLKKGSGFRVAGEPLAATRLGFTAHGIEELQQAVAWMA